MHQKMLTGVVFTAFVLSAIFIWSAGCSDNPVDDEPLLIVEVEPASFDLHAPYGGPSPPSTFVYVTSGTDEEIPFTFRDESSWMALINLNNTHEGVTPDSFYIDFFVWRGDDTLEVGTHADTIWIESDEASNAPLFIEVVMTISGKMVVYPSRLTFVASISGEPPEPKNIVVTSLDGGPYFYESNHSASWLSLNSPNGVASDTVAVSVNASALTAGSYLDTITFSAESISGSPQSVVCSLSVSPWLPQTTGYNQTLQDVYFADHLNGWAVGYLPGSTRNGLIYRTTDGGENWIRTDYLDEDDSALGGIAFISDTGWAVGENGIILHTVDGGDNWQYQSSGLPDTTVTLSDVCFVSTRVGWIVGDNGMVLTTSNGGTNWFAQNSGIGHDLVSVMFVDEEYGWAVGNANAIIHTTDGGQTWQNQSAGYFDFRGVFFTDRNIGWIVGKFGTVAHTINGGSSWTTQPLESIGFLPNLRSVYFINASTGWVVGDGGSILRTVNGGQYWQQQYSDTDKWLFSIFFLDEYNGWVVGDEGVIRHTTSGGY